MEEWKELQENPHYEVSSYGNIREKETRKIKKQYVLKNGYAVVSFYENGKQRNLYVHRLVASSFLGASKGKLEINHKDGVKTNNNISNLEWVTHSENQIHSCRVLGRKPRKDGYHKKITIGNKRGDNVRLNLKLLRVKQGLSQKEFAEKLETSITTYNYIESGRRFGNLEFWNNLQKTFNIPDEEMFKLMKTE